MASIREKKRFPAAPSSQAATSRFERTDEAVGKQAERLVEPPRKRQEKQFFLLREDAIPEVQRKVMQVKENLAAEPELSVQQACREVHLSRSAFYKYRDSIYPYNSRTTRCFSYQRLLVEKNRSWPEALLAVGKMYNAILTQWLQEEIDEDLLQIRLRMRLIREADGDRIARHFLHLRGVREVSHEEQSVID